MGHTEKYNCKKHIVTHHTLEQIQNALDEHEVEDPEVTSFYEEVIHTIIAERGKEEESKFNL